MTASLSPTILVRFLAALALVVTLVACSSGPAATVIPTATLQPTPPGMAATVAPSAPAATAQFPAPTELVGRWRTVIGPGDAPILTIRVTGYVIQRFGTGTGPIEVHGDTIDFLASNVCDGVGHYRWSIEADGLHLDSVGADECPGRADALNGRVFSRLP